MKKYIFILLVLFINLACSSTEKTESRSEINIDLTVSYDLLKEYGYVDNDSLRELHKFENGVNIIYSYLPNYEVIMSKTIHLIGVDSTSAMAWIKDNGGVLASDLEKVCNRVCKYRCFIRDKSSGLILIGLLYKNSLSLSFEYPDTPNYTRTKFRTIGKDYVSIDYPKQNMVYKRFD
ncbi:hypothetical protein [Fulvivirga ligni]|uniref:hypothetical protein n=1 Tax=Fulvivirga ligni TaxID=2904246 RepID=UPI001F437792|nr:hypothetical protein [Fulvivirga ligni]UII20377.1 hypothetical protein LVD16_21275 [Fulvivirga ligni]